MPKTPLSAPGGSYRYKNQSVWNSGNRRGGYVRGRSYGHQYQQRNDVNIQQSFSPMNNQTMPRNIGDDFIPLGFSSPVNQMPAYNNFQNWRGHGNPHRYHETPPSSGHPGFNNSYGRNFYHESPKSSFNNSNSPKFHQNQHCGKRRPYQKHAHRQVDISKYLDIESILEDPWSDLMKNLTNRNTENDDKSKTPDLKANETTPRGSILVGGLTDDSKSHHLDLVCPKSQITTEEKSGSTSTGTITTTVAS